MGYRHKILFIEDERDHYNLAVNELAGGGLEFEPALAAGRAACTELLKSFNPDIVIADYHLPDIEGPEILKMALERAPLAPFIALSGQVSDQQGLELEKLGAFKYLPKDRLGRLPQIVAAAVSKLAYTRPRILFLEDELQDYTLELKSLEGVGINYLPMRIQAMAELSGALDLFSPNIIVTDYMLAGFTAVDVIGLARQRAPLTPVIVVSGSVGEEKAIELFRAGAADYVLKDNIHRLGPAVRRVTDVMRENVRKEAVERELREAAELRRIILDAVKAPFFLADARGRAILGNTSASVILELPELAGADIFAAAGEYSAEIKKLIPDCGKSGAPIVAEHRSGRAVLETHVYPVAVPAGERAQFAVISLDITGRKCMEAEKERLCASLREGNLEMEKFLYITTHDLRGPLVNIQGFSQNLGRYAAQLLALLPPASLPAGARAELEKLTRDQIPAALDYVLGSARKMDSLLTALLKVSRLGRLEMKPETVEMNKFLGRILDSLRCQLEAAGGELKCGDLPPCKADPVAVDHIFTNLLDNAIKYRHKDRAPVITVSGEVKGGMVVYKISDNGSGIPEADVENIWKLFYKGSKREERRGEGIGLSTARGLAEKNGGSIRVESREGEGSAFYLELPAAGQG